MNTEYDGTFADMAGYCPQMSGGAKQRLTGDIFMLSWQRKRIAS